MLVDFGDRSIAYVNGEDDRRYTEEIASVLKNYRHKTIDEVASMLYASYGATTKGEVRNLCEFWKLFLENLGIAENSELIRELRGIQNRHAGTILSLYDGATQVLSALREKYKLALVSNCAIGLSDVVEALGLTRFFDAVILSYEVGARKPDRRTYLEALRRLDLRPENCAFVSDEISDLEGAREVGLRAVLVRQGDRITHDAKDPDFEPDYQSGRISEIMEFFQ